MTSICVGGGPSEAKPEFAEAVYIGPAMIAALLNNIPTPWAVGLAGAVGAITYSLSTLCPNEPPAVPTLTAADGLALLNPDPLTYIPALQKLQQLIGAYAWHQFCKCTTGATPAPPTPPSKPTGWPDIDPPSVAPPPSTLPLACYDNVTNTAISSGSFHYANWLWRGIPSDLKSFRVTIKQGKPSSGTLSPVEWTIRQTGYSAIGEYWSRVLPPAFEQVLTFPVVPPSQELRIEGTASYNQTERTIIEIEGFCGAYGPPIAGVQCCPPDPQIQLTLNQLMSTVTLMQRQLAPFAYVSGASHAGLTGDGEIAIQGLLGAKVSLTTIPASRGVAAGEPDELFDIGFVTFAVTDGYPHSVRIEHNPHVILPARASVFTRLSYSLTPGVVATITELVREP